MSERKLTEIEKFEQMDKEALYTLALAIVITLFFWLAIFIFKNSLATIMGLPLWFLISCIGGYLLSVIGVYILTKFFMQDFSLEDE